jgi:Fe-S-cluster-containing dehydrogenase component
MKKYELVIDHKSCWGCKTCEVACKQENITADGIKLIYVSEDGPKIVDGKLDFVVMDYDKCTGCESCIEACPYEAIAFDPDKGIAQKCNLCHHRVDKGLLPACADNICLAHCIFFGEPEEIGQRASL